MQPTVLYIIMYSTVHNYVQYTVHNYVHRTALSNFRWLRHFTIVQENLLKRHKRFLELSMSVKQSYMY